MKKINLMVLMLLSIFVMIGCSTSSRITSENIVKIIDSLEMNEVDNTFYQELKDNDYRGDAYYLLGEENDYIELTMYYKQKYVQMFIDFDVEENNLFVEQISIEYIDLLDEIYVNFDTSNEENLYDMRNKTYDEFFEELDALTISDIEWILTSLELM